MAEPAADPSPHPREGWFPVALLLRPQGRRGELLADPLTGLTELFAPGREFRIASGPESLSHTATLTLETCWRPQGRNAGRLVLKFAGIESISAAEALQTKQLYLRESALPALAEDTFLVRDLVGCALFNGEQRVGVVQGLEFPVSADGRTRLTEAADLLVVSPEGAPAEAEPLLIPFVKSWLGSIDLIHRQIRMHLPAGLADPGAQPPSGADEKTP